jgi:hypothetical protein
MTATLKMLGEINAVKHAVMGGERACMHTHMCEYPSKRTQKRIICLIIHQLYLLKLNVAYFLLKMTSSFA